MVTQLQNLRKGRIFFLDGIRYKLLYVNSCRAHVQCPDKQVAVNGTTFKRSVTSDWAPTTIVEVRGGGTCGSTS